MTGMGVYWRWWKGCWRFVICMMWWLWIAGGAMSAQASMSVQSGETEDSTGLLLDQAAGQLNFQDIEQFLTEQQMTDMLGFQETMGLLMDGRFAVLGGRMLESFKQLFFGEIGNGGKLLGQLLALGILGAVFTNFSSVFDGSQVSETGFFVTYLLLFTLLTAGLGQSIQVAADAVDKSLTFMKVLTPVYFLAVALSGGSVSAAAMYEFTLVMVTVAQWLLGNVMLPAVRIYLLFVMAGNMVKEEFLSRLTALGEQLLGWGMKTLLGVVLGFHLIQGMVLPYVDSLKNGSVQKVISMIPGIGQGASSVAQLLLSSGMLIKNTIGMTAVVILLVIVAVPVVKLVVLMFLYQCVAAVMEPVCDKRLVACVAAAADSHKILLKIVSTAVLLLILTVALACAGTNVG